MRVADIENLHVFVPYLFENLIIFLEYFILILKMHRFCAMVVTMTDSVASFCRLFGKKNSRYGKDIDLRNPIKQCLNCYLGF
jgi:membrane glycosyltransferase